MSQRNQDRRTERNQFIATIAMLVFIVAALASTFHFTRLESTEIGQYHVTYYARFAKPTAETFEALQATPGVKYISWNEPVNECTEKWYDWCRGRTKGNGFVHNGTIHPIGKPGC